MSATAFAGKHMMQGDTAGGDLTGTFPSPSLSVTTTGQFIHNQNSLQSGSTFYVSSGTVTGTVSAGTFSGSGSGLTALPATNLTGLVPNASIDGSSITKQGAIVAGTNVTLTPGSGNLTVSAASQADNLGNHVATMTLTAGYGINATTYTIGGTNVFVSTFSSTDLLGYRIYASTGAIGSNTSITISMPNTTSIWFPLVSELEGVNTAACSIRIKSIGASSYVIYNSDIINAKNYITWVFAK